MRGKSTAERLSSRRRNQERMSWQPPQDAIVLYSAYGTGRGAVVDGRVIDYQHRRDAAAADRKLVNLRRNLRLLINDERANVPVRLTLRNHQWHTVSDEEGYFHVEISGLATLPPGWHRFRGYAGDAVDEASLLLVPPENTHGVISDVDDTLLITDVGNKRRALINTLLRNPLQRLVVDGIATLYRHLTQFNPFPAATPFFYLSATPRQLHLPMQTVLEHNRLPRGVLITKRVTGDSTSEPVRDQFAYKTRKIESILERLPHVNFTLIGDDGEKDPEVFDAIAKRYPSRIKAVWIRKVNSDPLRPRFAGQSDLSELLQPHSARR